jgi:hypothetical protein
MDLVQDQLNGEARSRDAGSGRPWSLLPKSRQGRLGLVLAVAAGGLLGALWLLSGVEDPVVVVREGHLLAHPAYASTPAVELRLFDAWSIHAHPAYANLLNGDVVVGFLLAVVATIAASGLLVLRAARAGGARLRLFLGLSALGLAFLAVDELLGLHETLGFNLLFLADLPGVTYADDPLFAAYALAALAFVVAFRDIVTASRAASALFALGIGLVVVAGLLDLSQLTSDEPFEPVAALLLVAGFARLVSDHVGAAVRPADPREPSVTRPGLGS